MSWQGGWRRVENANDKVTEEMMIGAAMKKGRELQADGAVRSLDRRRLLGLAAAGAGLLLAPPLARSAEAPPANLAFDVYRKGSKIGVHRITFVPKDGGFQAQTEINLAVKIAFITVYTYQQIGHDEWRDGVLVGSEVSTNDDGKKTKLAIDETNGRLTGNGANGQLNLQLGIMTDLSWWNRGIVDVDKVLDSQLGEVGKLTIQKGIAERIEVNGASIDAMRYRMASTKGREGDIWYAGQRWVKAICTTRGETLDYDFVA